MVVTSKMIRQLGCGAARAGVGCSFIELTGMGVSNTCIGCASNVMVLFVGAKVPWTVGATIRWNARGEVAVEGPKETKKLG